MTGGQSGDFFENPDAAGSPEHGVDSVIYLLAKLIFEPGLPVLPATPDANHHEDSRLIQPPPRLPVKLASLSDGLTPEVPEPLPHRVFVTRFDPALD